MSILTFSIASEWPDTALLFTQHIRRRLLMLFEAFEYGGKRERANGSEGQKKVCGPFSAAVKHLRAGWLAKEVRDKRPLNCVCIYYLCFLSFFR